MVRSAVADERLISYFNRVAKQNTYSVGLILGQLSGKDYVIHFARTPPFHPHDKKETQAPRLTSIDDVNEDWVADHARQTTRTLSGGMHVLGLFIVSPEDLLTPFAPKIKGILSRTHKHLDSQQFLFGNANSEKLVLNYCTNMQQFFCKSYDVGTGRIQPAEFKFSNTAMKWLQIECKFHIDQTYYITSQENDWPLKNHMGIILDVVKKNLKNAVFLFEGELKDADESIDSVGKNKNSRTNKPGSSGNSKPIRVTIMQHFEEKQPKFEITGSANQLKIFGHVVSKLWLNPKMSISAASEALAQDILRSLSTRLEMHWDSLTEEEHGEDVNSIHEPPRRVLAYLPNSEIAVSDYLFPGEGPHDARISLEEILDIKLNSDKDVLDFEGQADLSDYYYAGFDSDSEEVINRKTKRSSKLYVVGLVLALLVLIISLVVHFIKR